MIRVLVVEDSAVTREYLVYLLEEDPGLQVAGLARDGLEGVEQAERLKPDVILMDIHMPRMDGLEATRQIMARVPTPIVLASSSFAKGETTLGFEAIQAGALTVVPKPAGPDHPDQAATARCLVETVKLMSEVKVVRRWPRREHAAPVPPTVSRPGGRLRLIAIGASTGGPVAIAEILGRLPPDLGAPILLVQHIAPGFTAGLASWLGQATRLAVKLAEPNEATRAGAVYVAPEGFQLGVDGQGRIRLSRERSEDDFCPSASYLFQSVAEAFGSSAMGIILTGMGRDGASGLRRLREAGGTTIAQDEETSVVFGMPQEAIRLGAAEYVLPPDRIAETIRSLAATGATG